MNEAAAGELTALVAACPWLMAALRAARALQLGDWCIGAGAVRNLVWDQRHGRPPREVPPAGTEIDLVYFNAGQLSADQDAAYAAQLHQHCPGLVWDVTNQAGVHRWYEASYGIPLAPLPSLPAGLATWPETATAVGVRLEDDDRLTVLAPFGLDDLFGLVLRRNPALVTEALYRERLAAKRFTERWPLLTMAPA